MSELPLRHVVGRPGLSFGPFTLRRDEKLLLDGGGPVRIGGRALDLLIALAERAGTVVSRDELVSLVWPTTVVEETSLRFHISALRKALRDGQDGARYIANIPGRGYSFVAPVRASELPAEPLLQPLADARPVPPSIAPDPAAHTLPSRLSAVVGRGDAIEHLSNLLAERRLVSIVGPGGIGKTTVALEVARARQSQHGDGVFVIDFSAVTDADRVLPTVAASLTRADDIPPSATPQALLALIHRKLQGRRTLLVLDTCEHLLDAAAQLAESVLRASPGATVLATTREALNAEGEWVHRLEPLAMPRQGVRLHASEALSFGAVRLFVDRANAGASGFVLGDEAVDDVVALCRYLEGNPLGLELAAGRVDSLGVKGLLARLDSILRVLSRGRRTADPRQSSVVASLQWSYGLLDEADKTVFRRLSVLRGPFDLRSAFVIAGDESAIDEAVVVDSVMSLAAKSLLAVHPRNQTAGFRLRNLTRSFGLDKLAESGEAGTMLHRHAEHVLALLQQCRARAANATGIEVEAEQLRPDALAAIDWASSGDGDGVLARALSDAFEALQIDGAALGQRAPHAAMPGLHDRVEPSAALPHKV